MSPELLGTIVVCAMLILMFLGLPVWICLFLSGFVGFVILAGSASALASAALTFIGTSSDYTFAVVPVFLLMGELGDISGMMRDAYRSTHILLSRVPGGLAMASVVGSAVFSLVSGSSIACTAIMSRIALPELIKHKYDPGLAAGALVAGGTLGNLVPPGTLIVIYALIANVSFGKLFIACYIPGFLLTAMYMLQIYIQCKLKPSMGPVGESRTWKEKLFALKGLVAVFIILTVTMGGIQFGIFTPNEAASICTIFVLILAVVRKTVNRQNMRQAFQNTIITTGMVLAMVIGGDIFNIFIAQTGVPQALCDWMVGLHLSKVTLLILIMIVYFILGMPLNGLTIILLTLPILRPVLVAYDIDLIWFGVLAIVQCELSNASPPIGLNLFAVAAISKPWGISIGTIFRGAWPFCGTCCVFIALLIAFPQISLFLVSLMK